MAILSIKREASTGLKLYKFKCRVCGKPIWRYRTDRATDICGRKCAGFIRRQKNTLSIANFQFCGEKMYLAKNSDGTFSQITCSKSCGSKLGWQKKRKVEGTKPMTLVRDGQRLSRSQFAAEKMLGRKLRKGEIVHHLDLNPSNNSLENLFVYSSIKEHISMHAVITRLAFLKLKELGYQIAYHNGTPLEFKKIKTLKKLKQKRALSRG